MYCIWTYPKNGGKWDFAFFCVHGSQSDIGKPTPKMPRFWKEKVFSSSPSPSPSFFPFLKRGWVLEEEEGVGCSVGRRRGGKWVMGLLKKLFFEPTRHFLPLPFFSFSAEARLSSLSSGSQLLFTPKPNSSSDFLGGEEEEDEEEEEEEEAAATATG